MTVRWTVRAANDRSRAARQESNPVSSSKNPECESIQDFYLLSITSSLKCIQDSLEVIVKKFEQGTLTRL